MLQILLKVFTNQNGGYFSVDLFNRLISFFVQLFQFFSTFFSPNFFPEIKRQKPVLKGFHKKLVLPHFTLVNFYHHSPKEWVSVPMPPFLK